MQPQRIRFLLLCSWSFIFTARRYASAVYAIMLSSCVCPSVRLSVISRHCITQRVMQTTPYDSPGTLVFRCQRSRQNSNAITLTTQNHPIFDTLYQLSYLCSEWKYRLQIWYVGCASPQTVNVNHPWKGRS